MGWKQRISVFVLVVLAALPVSGTLCGMLCDWGAQAASAHHASGKNCEDPGRPSDDARMGGIAAHDCSNHDAGVRQLATTAAARGDLAAASAPGATVAASAAFTPLPNVKSFFASSPPGAAQLTTTPLVLRV